MIGWFKRAKKPSGPVVREWAMMRTDFPDDTVWEGHHLVQIGGRNVTVAVKEILEGLGYTVSEPEEGGDHGWLLSLRSSRMGCSFQITDFGKNQITDLGEQAALLVEEDRPWRARDRDSSGQAFRELLKQLHSALQNDGRFHDIIWYPYDDFLKEGKGAPEPVSEPESPPDPVTN